MREVRPYRWPCDLHEVKSVLLAVSCLREGVWRPDRRALEQAHQLLHAPHEAESVVARKDKTRKPAAGLRSSISIVPHAPRTTKMVGFQDVKSTVAVSAQTPEEGVNHMYMRYLQVNLVLDTCWRKLGE